MCRMSAITAYSTIYNDKNKEILLKLHDIQKFILAGDWSMRFGSIPADPNRSALRVTEFEAEFMAIAKDGQGPHTHQISNLSLM
jgi:hypothetical protein